MSYDETDAEIERDIEHLRLIGYVIPRAQYEALMAAAFWLLKLRSLGYISAGHGRQIADEALAIVRATGIEIKADTERDERLRSIGLRAAGIDLENKT